MYGCYVCMLQQVQLYYYLHGCDMGVCAQNHNISFSQGDLHSGEKKLPH